MLLVLAAAAYAAYAFVRRPPEKRACARMAELCGLGDQQVEQCVSALASLKRSNAASVARATACVAGAKSCGETMGCVSGAALNFGAGFVTDFLTGVQKAAK